MTDVTQGQDAPTTAHADTPDVDDLFPKQDVDDLFPANYKPTSQPVRNVSPIQDMIFFRSGTVATRAHPRRLRLRLCAGLGRGRAAASEGLSSEADEWLRKAGMWNDYSQGQRSIIKLPPMK